MNDRVTQALENSLFAVEHIERLDKWAQRMLLPLLRRVDILETDVNRLRNQVRALRGQPQEEEE